MRKLDTHQVARPGRFKSNGRASRVRLFRRRLDAGECRGLGLVNVEDRVEPRDDEDVLELFRQAAQLERAAAVAEDHVPGGKIRYARRIDRGRVLHVDDDGADAVGDGLTNHVAQATFAGRGG